MRHTRRFSTNCATTPRSNIIDKLSDLLKPRKPINALDLNHFMKALKRNNIPRTYIGNPEARDILDQEAVRLTGFRHRTQYTSI